MNNLETLVTEYQTQGNAMAESKLVADQLEEGAKPYLASLINDLSKTWEGVSEAKLDRLARGSKEYRDYIDRMCIAKSEYLKAKVRFDALSMLFEARRTEASTQRAMLAKGIFEGR